MPGNQRVGIMGGTFDPIHIGHLVIAEAVRIEYLLDKIIFIPAANPPHKQNSCVTDAMARYAMTVLATYSNPYFFVSDIELRRAGPSYSIDTVKALIELYGKQTEFYFITGADTIQEIPTWKDIDDLLNLCNFVATARPGCINSIDNIVSYFGEKGRRRIHRLVTPELEISSTDIRQRIKLGKSIKYIVPESVENYLYKEKLY
ncbi:MAG: nicotinate-nucleotide adenylyltransferase [Pelosinus sp.]|nr:nicotinate-nucleotide adenylyltransferase [Pelosinus sp.]